MKLQLTKEEVMQLEQRMADAVRENKPLEISPSEVWWCLWSMTHGTATTGLMRYMGLQESVQGTIFSAVDKHFDKILPEWRDLRDRYMAGPVN